MAVRQIDSPMYIKHYTSVLDALNSDYNDEELIIISS